VEEDLLSYGARWLLTPFLMFSFFCQTSHACSRRPSAVFLPVVGAYGIFTMIRHFQHDHHAHSVSGDEPDRVLYPYINIRNKPLPWSLTDKAILGRGSNCALFDYECAKKERAAAAAAAAAAE